MEPVALTARKRRSVRPLSQPYVIDSLFRWLSFRHEQTVASYQPFWLRAQFQFPSRAPSSAGKGGFSKDVLIAVKIGNTKM